MGAWEHVHNHNFNRIEFDAFKNQAGDNSFMMSPKKWIENTNAIGIKSKAGRHGGGTFAHKDIAFEFAVIQITSLLKNNSVALLNTPAHKKSLK
jgi:hypothetical protein